MELKFYLDFLRRRWWLLLLGPLVAATAAFLITNQMTPVYQATSTVLVDRTATPGTLSYEDVLTSQSLTNTYAKLVQSPAVLDSVISRLNLTISRSELDAKISVSPIANTQLLEVSAEDTDPAMAAQLANTTAEAFADNNATQLSAPGTVSVAKEAQVPAAAISPKLSLNVAFAFVLGVMAAAGLGLLFDYLDDTVKTTDDVEGVASAPTLGVIGKFRGSQAQIEASELQSRHAEAYRQLRTNIHFTDLGARLKTIVVTSANPGEGKSTTASNLAAVLAQAGDRVILVDADLRRSSLRRTFKGPTSFGLTGLLYNDVQDPLLALTSTRWNNLRLLPAGVLPPNPSELLTSTRMTRLLEKLRGMADYVIFDTPPVLAVTDAIILAANADATIVIAEAGKTRKDALRETARALHQANAKLLGVVINRAKVRSANYYYYRDDQDQKVEVAAEAQLPAAAELPEYISRHGSGSPASEVPEVGPLDNSGSTPDAQSPAASSVDEHVGNGNGNVHEAEPVAAAHAVPLNNAVSDLLSHLDDTMGLIRSLRPGDRGQKEDDL